MPSPRLARLALASYPRPHRRRYGDEMAVLVEEAGATRAVVADLFRGAFRAHLRPAAVRGSEPGERLRLGASAVLFCWVLFAAAIFGFAKATEEGSFQIAASAHPLIGGAHLALQILAVIASLAFLVGLVPLVAVALPQVRENPELRRPAFVAVGCVALGVAATVGFLLVHRNPTAAAGPRAALPAAWTAIVLACGLGCAWAGRRGFFAATIPADVLRLVRAAAATIAVAMVGIAVAAAVYVGAILIMEPGLADECVGHNLPFSVAVTLGACLIVMVLSASAGGVSAVRSGWGSALGRVGDGPAD
jgi:hypothetical protein